MPRLLHEIEWSDPVLPVTEDPAWAAEVERVYGEVPPALLYPAPSRWFRQAMMQITQLRPHYAKERHHALAILVTSQENSCRFCYGSARAYLKMLGVDDRELDRVERDAKLAGADENERALLRLCRNLSKSNPRPARSELDALAARGFDPLGLVEIAGLVAGTCFNNRAATFLAVPLDARSEQFSPGPVARRLLPILRRFGKKYPRPLAISNGPRREGPFSDLVALVKGTEGELVWRDALNGAFESPVLPARTRGWVFAVVARALSCPLCEAGSARVLDAEGVSPAVREQVLGSLSGRDLTPVESVLLPWVRETAHYQTEVMQRKTRELRESLGDDVVLEAIGMAALANACARLSMLAQ